MADPTNVNPQIIDVINQSQLATMSPSVVKTSGAGKAYQSVAQSAAIAVQDAADNLRNLSTMSTTAIGVAMAQLLAHGDPNKTYSEAIKTAQDLVDKASTQFKSVGTAAAQILQSFPSG